MKTKHVAPSGNDANTGDSFAQAYRSLNQGRAHLASGDLLKVYGTPGARFDYREGFANGFPTAGSWADATRVEVESGHDVWLKPTSGDYAVLFSQDGQQYIRFTGLNIDAEQTGYGGVKIEGWANGNPHHISLQHAKLLGSLKPGQGVVCDAQKPGIIGGNEFLDLNISRIRGDDYSHGFYIKSGGNLIDLCNVYDVPGACVHLYATYPAEGNLITRCRLHDIVSAGPGQRHWAVIVTDNCPNTIVLSNIIFNIPNAGASSCGMLISQNANGAKIGFNSITQCAGVGLQIDPTVSGAVVRNNVLFKNATNFVPGNASRDHNIEADPQFTNPAQNDFTITSTASPAYRAGVKVAGWTHDALMALYHEPPSCGAYEIPSGNPDPGPEVVELEGTSVTVSPGATGLVHVRVTP